MRCTRFTPGSRLWSPVMDMSDYQVTAVAYAGNRPSRMSPVMLGQRAAEVASDARSAGC